jgi:hypothetical protein
MKRTTWSTALLVAASAVHGGAAWAQDPEADPDDVEEAEPAEPTAEEQRDLEELETGRSGEADVADAAHGDSAVELPGETYRFVGARYRGIVVPKFMMNLFADGGDTVYVHAFGPEFAIRKDGFEYNLSAWLGLYHMDPTAFKGKSDEQIAWEHVESRLNILFLTSDFLWSHEFSPAFALNYGVGAGFGIVFGELRRTQVYPGATADINDPNTWQACQAQFSPDPIYCDDDNDHYPGYTEPSWANGGSKPIIFPWLALQTGFRYKVARQFVTRLDLGFGTSGFFFGIGADYGL